jgi:hypothetical protein
VNEQVLVSYSRSKPPYDGQSLWFVIASFSRSRLSPLESDSREAYDFREGQSDRCVTSIVEVGSIHKQEER